MVTLSSQVGMNNVPLVIFPDEPGEYHFVQFSDFENNDYLRFGELDVPYDEIEKRFDREGVNYVVVGCGLDKHFSNPRFDFFRDDPYCSSTLNKRHLTALDQKIPDHYLLAQRK